MGEKSFIPEVLQKEAELDALLHSAKEESEKIIGSAKQEVDRYLREFEEKLPSIVRERYETEMIRIQNEARHIKDVGQLQTEELKKKTMEKLDLAVQEIIRVVLPVPLTDEKNSYDNEDEQSGDHWS
jgi:vacuolar-type H+-ATPase subunit H